MEVKVKNYSRQSDEQYSLARQLLKSGNKAGAQQALKRRELYLTQISNSHSKIANLQRIIDTVDISADNVSLTETLEQAKVAIDSNIDMASAHRIPKVNETGAEDYQKDMGIYSNNAFYPVKPVALSAPMKIRGVDAVMLGITPFKYNPVTKELIVYRDIEVEVNFSGGTG